MGVFDFIFYQVKPTVTRLAVELLLKMFVDKVWMIAYLNKS